MTRIILKFMPKGLTQKWSEKLRIPSGDVTGDALVEPEMPEQAEGGGETLLAMPPLILEVVEGGKRHREAIGRHAAPSYRQVGRK